MKQESEAQSVAPIAKAHTHETLGMWLGLVGVIIFAGTLPATRLAVAALDPLFTATGRAAVAGLFAAIILFALRRRLPTKAQFRLILINVAVTVIGFPALMALALQTVPASHGGVVLGILPLSTAAAAALFLGERPSGRFWAFAVLGTAVVVVFALRDSGGRFAAGDFYMFAAALCASVGYAYSGHLARQMRGWEVICWILVCALPITIPGAFYFRPANIHAVPLTAWAGFAYVSLFSMFIGFFAWNAGLAMGGVARVSQVQLLQTFITLGLAALINREHIDPATVVAALAVVAFVAMGRRTRVTVR